MKYFHIYFDWKIGVNTYIGLNKNIVGQYSEDFEEFYYYAVFMREIDAQRYCQYENRSRK